MKNKSLAVALMLAIGLAACLYAKDAAAAPQGGSAEPEANEAPPASGYYTYAQKAQFIEDMKRELQMIDDELDLLADKVDRLGGEAKAGAKAKLKIVRAQWAQAEKELQRAENATEPTWNDVKNGFDKVYGEAKDSFEKTRQWINDRIEPEMPAKTQ